MGKRGRRRSESQAKFSFPPPHFFSASAAAGASLLLLLFHRTFFFASISSRERGEGPAITSSTTSTVRLMAAGCRNSLFRPWKEARKVGNIRRAERGEGTGAKWRFIRKWRKIRLPLSVFARAAQRVLGRDPYKGIVAC